jgi:hypothetical protein
MILVNAVNIPVMLISSAFYVWLALDVQNEQTYAN